MKRARRWLLGVVASFLIVGALPAVAEEQISSPTVPATTTAPAHTLLISEVQTATPVSASQEFIELFNNGTTDIDLSGWHVQYFSSSTTDFTKSPTRNIALADVLARHDYYLIVSTGYLPDQAQATYSAGLSASAGYLRIVDADSQVQDLIGWGVSAALAEGGHPVIPGSDTSTAHSFKRKVNEDGVLQDTNDNLADFIESATPTPQPRMETVQLTQPDSQDPSSDSSGAELPSDGPTTPADDAATEPETETSEAESDSAIPVEITELLPNPASPQTDSNDEFVELHNPSESLIDLAGLKLQTGTTFSHNVLLDDVSISAGGYYVLYSKDTSLTLSNSGGNARIVDKDGAVVADSAPYDTAPDGQSWVLYEGTWQWSSTPTPLAANIVTSVAATTKSAAKTTAAAKKTTTKKATTATKTTAKKATTATASGSTTSADETNDEQPPAAIHPAILAGVGVLAVGYGAYEYRDDIRNKFSQRRANRKHRRALRAFA